MTLTLFHGLPPVGIAGLGRALPATLRNNDDPVYAELRHNDPFASLFVGYESRHVLTPNESLAALMASACRAALSDADYPRGGVGLLTGFASVSEFLAPNELFLVQRLLDLPEQAETIPVADEFTSFLSGLRLAANRQWLAQDRAALVVCGCRWTNNIDYTDPVSASIGDAAGAALVLPLEGRHASSRCFRLLGYNTEVPKGLYGVMRLAPRSGLDVTTLTDPASTTRPVFNLLAESEPVFRKWGTEAPPRLARALLAAAGVDPSDVTCVAHQASEFLLEAWRRSLEPIELLDTLRSFGNMTLASIPVTLSTHAESIRTRFVLLLGLGLGIHASACLLERR